MGIRSALGWLALLLFTTTAQAEGARELLRVAPKTMKVSPASIVQVTHAHVTPKTKAPPAPVPVYVPAVAAPASTLAIVQNTARPRTDYEADVYAGAPLDGAIAKERGLDKGLVLMVFERERRPAFRVGRDRIKRGVRLSTMSGAPMSAEERGGAGRAHGAVSHVDVLDTEDGVVVIDTQRTGMFVTSDVYAFPQGATLERRVGALEAVPAPARDRVREALVAAEWAPAPAAAAAR